MLSISEDFLRCASEADLRNLIQSTVIEVDPTYMNHEQMTEVLLKNGF